MHFKLSGVYHQGSSKLNQYADSQHPGGLCIFPRPGGLHAFSQLPTHRRVTHLPTATNTQEGYTSSHRYQHPGGLHIFPQLPTPRKVTHLPTPRKVTHLPTVTKTPWRVTRLPTATNKAGLHPITKYHEGLHVSSRLESACILPAYCPPCELVLVSSVHRGGQFPAGRVLV